MLRLDQRGVAATTVFVIIAISSGAAVVTPAAVDVVGVDPDHPLYGLERLGERIRMIGDEDQMMERWGEYQRMVAKGMGLGYKVILEEFVQKMREVVPGDVAAKQDIVQWMQEQSPEIGSVQLKLFKELGAKLKEDLEGLTEVPEEIENEIEEIENYLGEWQDASSELRENIKAHLRLIRERLENIAERHSERVRKPLFAYFDIDNILFEADLMASVELKIHGIWPPSLPVEFEEKLEEFENKLSEIEIMLEGSENTPGKRAVERLLEVAVRHRDNALMAYENKVRMALALIHTADIHLRNVERILEHASEWEPKFKEEWVQWKHQMGDIKQDWIGEGIWENILRNREKFIENIRHEWMKRKGVPL